MFCWFPHIACSRENQYPLVFRVFLRRSLECWVELSALQWALISFSLSFCLKGVLLVFMVHMPPEPWGKGYKETSHVAGRDPPGRHVNYLRGCKDASASREWGMQRRTSRLRPAPSLVGTQPHPGTCSPGGCEEAALCPWWGLEAELPGGSALLSASFAAADSRQEGGISSSNSHGLGARERSW